MFYFQLFICGNTRYVFPKHWNWQICQTHQTFKPRKLRTFPTVKSKTVGFLIDQTQQYTLVLFGKIPLELLLKNDLPTAIMQLIQEQLAHASPHGAYDYTCAHFENTQKHLAERLVVSQTCVSYHSLFKRGKNKSEHCCQNTTSLNLSIGTGMAKALNCIPRSSIVTTGFLLMVR